MADLTTIISEDAPSGVYLKEVDKSTYRSLRNALNMARSAYRSLTETPESQLDADLAEANQNAWQALADQCIDVLSTQTKDVELFVWAVGAQIHLKDGIKKTTQTMAQLADVLESHWTTLNPRPSEAKLKAKDEAGQAKEINEGLVSIFAQLIGEVAGSGMLAPALGDLPVMADKSYNQYLSAESKGELDLFREEALADFSSSEATLRAILDQLAALRETSERCGLVLNANAKAAGVQGQSFGFLLSRIDRIIDAMRNTYETAMVPWPLDAVEEDEPEADDAAGEGDNGNANANNDEEGGGARVSRAKTSNFLNERISSRVDAIGAIEALSRFFKETEPHSPIYMLLERAARWSRMPLPSVYAELLGDDAQILNRLTLLTGMESEGTVKKAPMASLDRFLDDNAHLTDAGASSEAPSGEAAVSSDNSAALAAAAAITNAPTPPAPPAPVQEAPSALPDQTSDVASELPATDTSDPSPATQFNW